MYKMLWMKCFTLQHMIKSFEYIMKNFIMVKLCLLLEINKTTTFISHPVKLQQIQKQLQLNELCAHELFLRWWSHPWNKTVNWLFTIDYTDTANEVVGTKLENQHMINLKMQWAALQISCFCLSSTFKGLQLSVACPMPSFNQCLIPSDTKWTFQALRKAHHPLPWWL